MRGMVLHCFQKPDFAHPLHESQLLFDGWMDNVHDSLKHGRGTVEPERLSFAIEQTMVATEYGLLEVSWIHRDLRVPKLSVKHKKWLPLLRTWYTRLNEESGRSLGQLLRSTFVSRRKTEASHRFLWQTGRGLPILSLTDRWRLVWACFLILLHLMAGTQVLLDAVRCVRGAYSET